MLDIIIKIMINPIEYFEKSCFFGKPVTENFYNLINFHNLIIYILIVMLIMLLYVIKIIFKNFKLKNLRKQVYYEFNHGVVLEIVWTILPIVLLIYIAFPSFVLLYDMDETYINKDKGLSVKIIGHQWYWSYEVNYIKGINESVIEKLEYIQDSYMIGSKKEGERYLNTDNPLYIPENVRIKGIITSTDVIHSWCLPELGIKLDAIPGRINTQLFEVKLKGIYYGQCSEICGVNHEFMPIKVVVY